MALLATATVTGPHQQVDEDATALETALAALRDDLVNAQPPTAAVKSRKRRPANSVEDADTPPPAAPATPAPVPDLAVLLRRFQADCEFLANVSFAVDGADVACSILAVHYKGNVG